MTFFGVGTVVVGGLCACERMFWLLHYAISVYILSKEYFHIFFLLVSVGGLFDGCIQSILVVFDVII